MEHRIKVDALERTMPNPDVIGKEDDKWTEGDQRAQIQFEGTPRSPSPTTLNPIDIAIQVSLEEYLKKALAGTPADAFSLTKCYLGRYREISLLTTTLFVNNIYDNLKISYIYIYIICIDRPQVFSARGSEELREQNLTKKLIAAQKRCEGWESGEIAGS